jgi:hypothetical protein
MESEIAERVGESSTRRTRPKTNRKSLAEPPLLPRSSQKKRRPRREATPAREYKEYPARKILDQKKENGRIKYLIDWEDDKVTKENFEPTWVRYVFLEIAYATRSKQLTRYLNRYPKARLGAC